MMNGHLHRISSTFTLVCLLSLTSLLPAADESKPGLEARIPWSTSRVSGSPDPALPYITELAFPALKFDHILEVSSPPKGDRLYVVEQAGKIFSFPIRPDVATADLVVDLKQGIPSLEYAYALEFHPDFARNRYCYVCYIEAPGLPNGTHISRFKVSDTRSPDDRCKVGNEHHHMAFWRS